jgi:uncharacterized protein YlzI (FlbEa/FlbD family)
MFIELTDTNNTSETFTLNKNHIVSVWKSATTTGIKTVVGHDYYVLESYEEVSKMLRQ